MGFTEEKQIKRGTRSTYVNSILTQLMDVAGTDDDILLWQQELVKEADIPFAAAYAPVMTALEMLGLVTRFTADAKEGLGKANTAYAWNGDPMTLTAVSSKRERLPGQTKADFEADVEEEEGNGRRTRRGSRAVAEPVKRSRRSEPEPEYDDEEYDDEPEYDDEEEEVTPRRRGRSKVTVEVDDEPEDDRPSRRTRRESAVTASTHKTSSRTSRRHSEEDGDQEDESPRRSRRASRSRNGDDVEDRPTRVRVKAEAEEEESPRRRPRRRATA